MNVLFVLSNVTPLQHRPCVLKPDYQEATNFSKQRLTPLETKLTKNGSRDAIFPLVLKSAKASWKYKCTTYHRSLTRVQKHTYQGLRSKANIYMKLTPKLILIN